MNDRWRLAAACLGVDPGIFFPEFGGPRAYDYALTYCNRCPVRLDCLEDAFVAETTPWSQMRSGMRGALTPSERVERMAEVAALYRSVRSPLPRQPTTSGLMVA